MEALEHVVIVKGRSAQVSPSQVVQHCVNADTVRLVLDGDWDGLDVSVVFAREGTAPVEVPYLTEPVAVPWRLLVYPGDLWLVVVGRVRESGEVTRQVATARLDRPLRVVESGEVSGSLPGPAPEDPHAAEQVVVPVVTDGVLSWRLGTVADELPGPVEVRGTQWLTGGGDPAIGGRPGDLYLDVDTGRIFRYGEKE